ncbi:MAG: PilN domain-containing protein [Myxococcota bacterium]|jgi:type IV pilus assembly protein PilN|nr:PilN domain-containing protein [Myxococcota bacterium]
MIRINLLPVSDEEVITQARIQLLLFVGLLVIEAIVLFLIFASNNSEIEELDTELNKKRAVVAQIKKDVQDADALKKETEKLEKQLDVLNQLKQKRSGPVRVLDELQSIMSPPRDEEDRFAQLQKNWNVEWDTRRLWIHQLEEAGGMFELSGGAVNADDVAEFLQRLNTAEHFYDIQLDVVEAKEESLPGGSRGDKKVARYVTFKLAGKISYQGKSKEPPPEPEDDKKKRGRKR